ncbi:MAG: SelB C-terminal domain-containing protein, partial [Hyphomicrobiaceae bacterium]
ADSVDVLGADMTLRVRGIHAQNAQSDTGRAGQRCALNLAGPQLRKDRIARGDWIVSGNVPPPVRKLDGELRVLANEARVFNHWTPVHVHLAAAETTGRVAVLESRSIAPGGSGLVQLVLDNPIGAVFGDRFIIRDQSAQRTIGGGRVIDVFPPARGRAKPERLKWLNAMSEDDHAAALDRLLNVAETGVELNRFAQNRNLTTPETADTERQADARIIAEGQERIAFSGAHWARLSATVRTQMAKWHAASPDVAGFSENRILDGTGSRINRRWAAAIAAELVRDGVLARAGTGVRIPSHSAKLQGEDAKLWTVAEQTFSSAGLRPITAREIAQDCGLELRKTESFLVRAGRLGLVARISKTRFLTPDQLLELAAIAEKLANADSDGMLMVAEFRDASGVGRNMTIEILEYFDRQKFTRRVGEGRKVVQAADKAAIIR